MNTQGKHAYSFVHLFIFLVSFFIISSCGGGGGGGGGTSGPAPGPSTFTFKAGWDNEGIVIDNQSLADVTVVRLAGGRYRLYADYYVAGDYRHNFVSYLSGDGLHFTQDPDYRWQGAGFQPFVLEFPGGVFRLYYTLTGSRQTQAISSATSTNGLTFTNEPGDRLTYNGRPEDAAGIAGPRIVRLPIGRYRMYYMGIDNIGVRRVLSAVSNDGVIFTRESGIRVDGLMKADLFLDAGGTWHLFAEAINSNIHGIYEFTSSDGLAFTIDPVPVVQSYRVTSTDTIIAEDPAVIPTDNGLRMYWMPYRGSTQVVPEPGVTAVWSTRNSALK